MARKQIRDLPDLPKPVLEDYRAAVAEVEARLCKGVWPKLTLDEDEVTRLPGGSRLRVRSMLLDNRLVGPAPIRFEGEAYRPVKWHEEGRGLKRRLIYEIEKVEADAAADYPEYTRPRSPERQKMVEALTRQRDRVQIFAPLWGLYPRATQSRLQTEFGFAACQWTAATAAVLFFWGALQLCFVVLAGAHTFSLAISVYLIGESLYRLFQSKVLGRPAASLAGCFLQIFLPPPRVGRA